MLYSGYVGNIPTEIIITSGVVRIMSILSNKVVVITGGTRGLGYAIASACAAAGASIVIASRTQKSVEEAVSKLLANGWKASGIVADTRSLDQMGSLAEHAIKTFDKFDVWFNNAGIAGPYGPTMALDPQSFQQVIETNIKGVYNGSIIAMRHFLPRHSGKLINLLGHGANGPLPWQNAYGSSKIWVRSFTLALAQEIKESGVNVFAFQPGMVRTELLTHVEVIEGMEQRLEKFPAVVRILAKPPEEAARKAVWLASPATDGMTGKVITLLSPWSILKSLLGEVSRNLFGRQGEDVHIDTVTIPPYNG
jgi:glucose 1-dehydrogenase